MLALRQNESAEHRVIAKEVKDVLHEQLDVDYNKVIEISEI